VSRPVRLRLRGVGVRHGTRHAWAVREVDLDVEPGERVLLTGASGSGKSTLLHAVGGLLDGQGTEYAGELLVDGEAPAAARDRLGLLAQDPDTQLVMTRAGDDVAFGLENAGVPPEAIWPLVDRALAAVGFGYGRDRPTQALSGGEKQRLVLAGALVREPGLLLLDEPTSQLDPAGAALVRDAVRRAVADRSSTVLLVDHDAEPWLPMVDRVVELLPAGGAVEHGPDWRPPSRRAGLKLPGPAAAVTAAEVVPTRRGKPAPTGVSGPLSQVGQPLITASGASYSYRGTPEAALPPTDAELDGGRALAVTGDNGSGKSTLALLLAGLRAPTAGTVLAADALAAGLRDRSPARWRAAGLVSRIGSVFQQPEHQFLTRRLRDELALGPLRSGAGATHARAVAFDLLDRLGLSAYAEANPFTLSGGQQRRLSVATALATAPRVLVLDEPTFGQDAATWREVVTLLAERRAAGCALAVVTHDRDLIDVLCDAELRL